MSDLQLQFGNIDIYLFDQLLRGRIVPGMRIFDSGCGSGRNIHYFLQSQFDVFGVDRDERAVAAVRALAARYHPDLPAENFRVEPVENTTFPSDFADVVISSAVLHFAHDEHHFAEMLDECWRLLRRGGVFFARLASSIGIEHQVQRVSERRHRLPDGSERFLVDAPMLTQLTEHLGASLLDPIKTTVVHNQRSMTTWTLVKQ